MESFLDTFLTIVMALLMVGFGVGCGVMMIREFILLVKTWQTSRENSRWPAVEGRITTGGLVRADGTKAAFSYSFCVNGQEFQVERQIFREYDSIRPHEAAKILERYPVDALIRVYYGPQNPKNCTLDPGLPAASFFSLILLPLVLLMPACFGLLIGFHIFSTLFQK